MFRLHTLQRFTASLLLVTVPIIGYTAGPASAYDRATVYNRTNQPVSGTVYYAACRSDNYSIPAGKVGADSVIVQTQTTMGTSRGACLITKITANVGGKAIQYTSSGTSYSKFIVAGSDTGYKINSEQGMAAEQANATGSPGFAIVNNTNYPVEVSLDQVACLYYGVVGPGQTFNRTTGAVWFTISYQQQFDMAEHKSLASCVLPVAAIVGSILLGALTAGVAAAAAPAAGTAAAALAPLVTSTAITVTGAAIGGAAAAGGTSTLVSAALGAALKPNGQGQTKGQYAGPPWPFRCTVKPTYTITGGWGVKTKDVNGNVVIPLGTPIKIAKTNTCGNGMM